MIQVLFAHDHTFKVFNGGYYSYGSYPQDFWSRYLRFSDQVLVLARQEESEKPDEDGYVFSFRDNGEEKVSILPVSAPTVFNRLGVGVGSFYDGISAAVDQSDCVVARLPSEIGYFAAICAIKRDKPVAIELVGCAFDAYKFRGGVLGNLYAPVSRWKTQRVCNRADSLLYVSNKLKDNYPSPSVNTVVASNVVIDKVDSISDVMSRRSAKSHECVWVGLIGSFFVNYKGVDVAIKAMALLRKRNVNVKLRILGEGERESYILVAKECGVEDAVFFDGLVPAGEPVREWLRTCDYYIQPSRTEGMPRGLLEAMAVGLPAVGSRAGGIPDLLDEENLHDIGDAESLAQRLEALLGRDYERESAKSLDVSSQYLYSTLEKRRIDFYSNFFGAENEPN